jgi:hypothetical protein
MEYKENFVLVHLYLLPLELDYRAVNLAVIGRMLLTNAQGKKANKEDLLWAVLFLLVDPKL